MWAGGLWRGQGESPKPSGFPCPPRCHISGLLAASPLSCASSELRFQLLPRPQPWPGRESLGHHSGEQLQLLCIQVKLHSHFYFFYCRNSPSFLIPLLLFVYQSWKSATNPCFLGFSRVAPCRALHHPLLLSHHRFLRVTCSP